MTDVLEPEEEEIEEYHDTLTGFEDALKVGEVEPARWMLEKALEAFRFARKSYLAQKTWVREAMEQRRCALQEFRESEDIPEAEARKLFTGMAGGASEGRYRQMGLSLIEVLDAQAARIGELESQKIQSHQNECWSMWPADDDWDTFREDRTHFPLPATFTDSEACDLCSEYIPELMKKRIKEYQKRGCKVAERFLDE